MKYMLGMLTVPNDAAKLSGSDIEAIKNKHAAFRATYEASGVLLNGAGLVFRSDSFAVDLTTKHTQRIEASGDDAEMTAYYVIECASDEEAAAISRELLDTHVVRVEVRKIHDFTGM